MNRLEPSQLKIDNELLDCTTSNYDFKYVLANNGWIMGGSNPLMDFAAADSKVYFRREVIIWGDCVKLRYGGQPSDCPFLWDHMAEYTKFSATHFHGFRIDNCHGTPIHVAEHLLNVARQVRPNLYVIAELFTGSEDVDNIFVKRLGIDSLVREAMSAPDCRELGRLIHRYGGEPIGSFPQCMKECSIIKEKRARALLTDATHDNEPPLTKRTVWNVLPNMCIVTMASCAIASNRGYDELVPHYIDVVNEERLYAPFKEESNACAHAVSMEDGLLGVRKVLNELHIKMAEENFSEIYVDQVNNDVITITRHSPLTRQSFIMVTNSAFTERSGPYNQIVSPIAVSGEIEEVLLVAYLVLEESDSSSNERRRSLLSTNRVLSNFKRDKNFINGIKEVKVCLQTHLQVNDHNIKMFQSSSFVENGALKTLVYVTPENFIPGSVFIIKTKVSAEAEKALKSLTLPLNKNDLLLNSIKELSLIELNFILFRCAREEEVEESGNSTYYVPNFGSLTYAGLQGFITVLKNIALTNDLGHPLCTNLRQGLWAAGYIINRLSRYKWSKKLGHVVKELLMLLSHIPYFLVPCYFYLLLMQLWDLLLLHAFSLMSVFIQKGDDFTQNLALVSLQMVGSLKSIACRDPSLPPQNDVDLSITMAAGLPHFCVGFMRTWGRDTFISLRGLLLLTGRYAEARSLIIGFAGTIRHGLIPNLLDSSRNSRYNCRDAVWFWLQAIQEYCKLSNEGENFLKAKIHRLYPSDDIKKYRKQDRYIFSGNEYANIELHDLIHYVLQEHARGIHFEEWGAGVNLDSNMLKEGFKIDISLNSETGLIQGGNAFNCGTWMDKMGEESIINSHCLNSNVYTDYQLRPNICIAMVVAPELFVRNHAIACLENMESVLLGHYGMKTLDPEDWAYRGDYNNDNDTYDPSVAKGANYHQGPEWIWTLGYFLRALLIFHSGKSETTSKVLRILQAHRWAIKASDWLFH
ncbi:hypothetical protein Zmor_011773 [Zophobas morio]|uniref:Glycogen debranching enzyme n=1 Tax=Zophobas morio TaxID=2755281 RepID=A0AA38HI82_9CUCU|nr:hypothetical protein Zmor_011773 [Zophobas morio]